MSGSLYAILIFLVGMVVGAAFAIAGMWQAIDEWKRGG